MIKRGENKGCNNVKAYSGAVQLQFKYTDIQPKKITIIKIINSIFSLQGKITIRPKPSISKISQVKLLSVIQQKNPYIYHSIGYFLKEHVFLYAI